MTAVAPYRDAMLTRERCEEIVAAVRLELQVAQRNLNIEQERQLRLEGAEAVLMAGCTWLERNETFITNHEGRAIDARRFMIWLLRSVKTSLNGKSFDVETGRTG